MREGEKEGREYVEGIRGEVKVCGRKKAGRGVL